MKQWWCCAQTHSPMSMSMPMPMFRSQKHEITPPPSLSALFLLLLTFHFFLTFFGWSAAALFAFIRLFAYLACTCLTILLTPRAPTVTVCMFSDFFCSETPTLPGHPPSLVLPFPSSLSWTCYLGVDIRPRSQQLWLVSNDLRAALRCPSSFAPVLSFSHGLGTAARHHY